MAASEQCIRAELQSASASNKRTPKNASNCGAKRAVMGMLGNTSACAKLSSASAPSWHHIALDTASQMKALRYSAAAHLRERLQTVLFRATRVHKQRLKDKNKLYAMHAPEVECIGKARKPYEFGVKTAIVVTQAQGLMVGARTFPGNPYDGHIESHRLPWRLNS